MLRTLLSGVFDQVLRDIVTKNICSVPWPFPSAPAEPTPTLAFSGAALSAQSPVTTAAAGTLPLVITASGQLARIGFVLLRGTDPLLESHLEKTAFDFQQATGSMQLNLHVANLKVIDARTNTPNRFPQLLGPSDRCKQRQLDFGFTQSAGAFFNIF